VRLVLVQLEDQASAVRSIVAGNVHVHVHVRHSPFALVAASSRSQWAVFEVDEA